MQRMLLRVRLLGLKRSRVEIRTCWRLIECWATTTASRTTIGSTRSLISTLVMSKSESFTVHISLTETSDFRTAYSGG